MKFFLGNGKALGLVLGLTLAFIAGGLAHAQDDGAWHVAAASGDVGLKRGDGAVQPLQTSDEIVPGSVVVTGSDGQVTLSRGETAVTLAPNGETEIPAASEQGGRTTLLQRLGTLLLKVEKRSEQHFQVDTPFLAAVVKGTTFTVSVEAQGSTVHVVEGAVEVAALGLGDPVLVRPGQTARISPETGGRLRLTGQAVPGDRNQEDQQSQADAVGDPAAGDQAGGAASPSSGSGLRIEQPVGWEGIDIAEVTDGFVSAAPGPGAGSGSDIGKAAAAAENAASSAVNGVAELAGGAVGAVASAGTGAASSAGSLLNGVGGAVGGVTGAVADGGGLGGTVQDLGSTTGSTVQALGNTVQDLGSTAGSTVQDLGSTVGTTVGSTVQGLGGTVGSTVQGVGSTVGSTVQSVGGAVQSLFGGSGSR